MNKIIPICLVALAFLVPLFFLPFTSEFYEFNKNVLLVVLVSIMLVVWLLKMALEKKITFRHTPLDLPVLVFAATFILSTLFVSTNKWETLWTPGGVGTIISLTLLYFIITNNLYLGGGRENTPGMKSADTPGVMLLNGLIFSACLLALFSLSQFVSSKISPEGFQATNQWFPAGGLIPLATFLVVSLSLAITRIYTNWKKEKLSISLYLYISISLLILAGLVVAIWQLLTTNKPLLLPYSTSWAIAVESFKNWRLFLFGVGPTSFLDAFSQFRPVSYNLSNFWAIRFGFSGNYYFHLLTTVGILGLGTFVWLIIKTIRVQIKAISPSLLVPFLTVLVIFAFLVPNLLLLFTLYLLLALLMASQQNAREYSENSRITPWVLLFIITAAILGNFYLFGRAYTADVYFRRSLSAFAQNDGTGAYNNLVKAITLNPFNDLYRLAYSQTNLALAYSLANKSDLSDQDRQDITILVQQAIREAKTAVNLNKNKVTNWENLAGIYRQLINFAQGADQWTIIALNQTIKLDPVNPNLRLTLGGIYYALNNYDEAIRFFQQAVELKPNFANGYYNLSAAYREKGDFQKAHDAMQMTLNMIPTTSEDYNKARGELDELAKKLPSPPATEEAEIKPQPQPIPTQEPLVEPEPYPSPVITPPIEIPEEQAAPDISPAPPATP